MAQAFVTTYKNHYRWNSQPKEDLVRPFDPCTEKAQEGDMWLTFDDFGMEDDDNVGKSLADAEAIIKELYKDRMQTTYQLAFCWKDAVKRKDAKVKEGIEENELLEYCRNLYDIDKQSKKVLPPLTSTKRVLGYLRPSSMYIPLTVYQRDFGKLGYNVFKKNMGVQDEKTVADKAEQVKMKADQELDTEERKDTILEKKAKKRSKKCRGIRTCPCKTRIR